MVVRFLIALLIFLSIAFEPEFPSARELCRQCHPVHYAEHGSCVACHRGNSASDRKDIAHTQLVAGRFARFTLKDGKEVRQGMHLLEQYACRRCHVIAGLGNRLSANLDSATKRKNPEDLANSIRRPVRSMPDFRCDDQGITAIINALLAAAIKHGATDSDRPQKVHFSRSGRSGQDIFSRRCGPCHNLLSEHLGALGSGNNIGPNLSGLLSQYYPKTFHDSDAWTVSNLAGWLKNPRAVKPWAMMQPVNLTRPEMQELATILSLQQSSSGSSSGPRP